MQKYGLILLTIGLAMLLVTGCTLPVYGKPLPSPTLLILPTFTSLPPTVAPTSQAAITAAPNPFPTLAGNAVTSIPVTQSVQTSFCEDGNVTALINRFKSALQASNGTQLASLVSPVHGMDARLFRNGRVVNYDRKHAKFLFKSTYSVNWGIAPGSGLVTTGAFHELVIPALLEVLNKNYTLTCNQIQVGGTTYQAVWPYTGINFYSVFYSGSQGNGSLDWHTWLLGMDYTNGVPYLYAIMQLQWEP